MTERHHVKTVPGEHVAPEYPEPDAEVAASGQSSDGINVAFVAVMVLFFAVFMLVSLISLQAMYYRQVDAEEEAKTAAEGSPGTLLGEATAKWDKMLHSEGSVDEILAPEKMDSKTGKMVYPTKVNVVPIEKAMQNVVERYTPAEKAGK